MKTELVGRPLDHIRHIAPITHAHINMRGIYSFDLHDLDNVIDRGKKGAKTNNETV